MANYNKVILVGNVTRDPETRSLANGSGVTNFSIAINRNTKQSAETMYVNIVAWEKLGEICGQYLKKGSPVLIEGRLSIRSYDDKDGVKRKAVEVVETTMQMLGNKPSNDSGSPAQSYGNHSENFYQGMSPEEIDDEIPF